MDHHCWYAYNESSDLLVQIALYRERFGFLPAKIYADRIYMNKGNRKLIKELEIQAMGKPLGRPPKQAQTKEHQAEAAKGVGERNEIEATFGTGKQYQGKVARNGQLLDGYVLFCEKCDGVPKGTSSCPDFCDQFTGKSRQYMENTPTIPEICLLWIFEWVINSVDPNYSVNTIVGDSQYK